MSEKEQVFAMLEGRIDTIQSLCKECVDLLYKAAYNEAIDKAAKTVGYKDKELAEIVQDLKK